MSQLAKLKAKKEAFNKRQEQFNRPKPNWFKINPSETLNIQFLQELDETSSGFNGSYGVSPADEKYNIGLFYMATEHEAPGDKGFLSRAVDTMETEGRDFAQEMFEKTGEKEWRARDNFYISVAVDRGGPKPVVEILSRNANNPLVDEIVDFFYEDEDNPHLTGRTFKIKKGNMKNSPFTIREDHKTTMDVSGLVPYDLARDAVRRVSYEEQKEYYLRNYTPTVKDDSADEAQTSFESPNVEPDPETDW
jgi:hypothetical protein